MESFMFVDFVVKVFCQFSSQYLGCDKKNPLFFWLFVEDDCIYTLGFNLHSSS